MSPTYAVLPLFITLVLAAVLVLGLWPRRSVPGATPFIVILIAIAFWALTTALALLSISPSAALWWTRISYLGSAFEAGILLVLALQFTGRIVRLPRIALGALLIEPLTIIGLVLTDDLHHLVWRSWAVVQTSGVSEVRPEHGPAFFVHNVYSYALIAAAVLMLVHFMATSARVQRRQLVATLLAIAFPASTNLVYSLGLWPWDADPMPFASLAGGLFLTYALFGAALFNVVPIAQRTVIQSLRDGVIVLNARGQVVDVNPVAAVMAGMHPSKLSGMSEVDVFSTLRQRASESEGTILGFDIDEQRRFVEIERLDMRGTPRGAALVLRDVTGHVLAERASQEAMRELDGQVAERTADLARTGERLEATLRSLADAVIVCDPGGYVRLMNNAAERLTGWLGSDAAGELWHRVIPGAPRIPTPARWLVEGPEDIELEDGRVLHAAMTSLTGGPESGGVILLISDVTDLRAAQRAGQQDAKLSALGKMAAGIAHDFNNYITGVLTFTQALREDPAISEEARRLLVKLEGGSHEAATLVGQILAFSQQPAGPREPVELGVLLRDLFPLLRGGIQEGIDLVIDVPSGQYWILANPGQTQQLITNLVSNAAEAVEEHGTITIGLSELLAGDPAASSVPGLAPGDWIELTVTDDGIGIDPTIIDRIFDPFFSTKRGGQASGMGLAQVYGVVRQYRGHVHVDSKLGRGTTVHVFLPPSAARPVEDAGAPRENIFGQGETVLLVEDDDLVSDVLKMALQTLGYNVIHAPNGLEGLRAFRTAQDQIAVVLTDITMPVMGGVELVRELMALDPTVRVVAMTGYAVDEDEDLRSLEGVAAWVEKPPELDELGDTLRRAIRAEDPGRAARDI